VSFAFSPNDIFGIPSSQPESVSYDQVRSKPRSEYWPNEASIRLWTGEWTFMFERNGAPDLRTFNYTSYSNCGGEYATLGGRVEPFCSTVLAIGRGEREVCLPYLVPSFSVPT
jgi:hypothetical protein